MEGNRSLRPLIRPRSVAVIGASRDPSRIGYRVLDALLQNRFQGTVDPVNPRAEAICGLRAYPSVRSIPAAVDLAIVAVPRDAVAGAIDDCIARQVPAVVVITAGFAESGPEGRALERQLIEKARSAGMRLLGPNCFGLINTAPDVRLNATFTPLFPPQGRIALSSDSGAMGLILLTAAAQLGIGISSLVTVGNRVDVSSNDLLEYWEEDEDTSVILLYLESFGNPRRFISIVRRLSRRKPIIAVKAGRSRAGSRAAASHTAALAASDVAIDALFHQTGVIRAATLEEMFDLAAALDRLPLPGGKRVGIITNAGGPAILCADACDASGLILPELSAQTRARLAAFLPRSASVGNPIDMLPSGTAEQYQQVVATLARSGEVDALIVILVCAGATPIEAFGPAIRDGLGSAAATMPTLTCTMAGPDVFSPPACVTRYFPCYPFPETAARVLGKMVTHADWRARPAGVPAGFSDMDLSTARMICLRAIEQRGAGWLTTEESRQVLRAAGLPVASGGVARDPAEAVELARRVGFPVAVKLASHRIIHKTEAGGVRLNVQSEDEVRQAFEEIRRRVHGDEDPEVMEGVLVQPMIEGGTEVLAGMTLDPLFGPLLAFGLGGIHVEVLGDVCFRVAPLTTDDAAEMVRGVRAHRLFEGYRGHPPADVPALEGLLLRLSCLVEAVPEMVELDLNPIFALAPSEGCRIVDARIRVGPSPVKV